MQERIRDISKFVLTLNKRKITLATVTIFIPEANNIFENIGVKGNSAIWSPSGDARLPLSSNAENANNHPINSWSRADK